jgi:hypothetical protein
MSNIHIYKIMKTQTTFCVGLVLGICISSVGWLAYDNTRLRKQAQVVPMTQQVAQQPSESAELQSAREQFAKVQQIYREAHPKYQQALHKVQGLEKQQTMQ